MNMVLSNTPAQFNFDFSDMIKVEVNAYLNINVYNYFITYDGGSVTDKNVNSITMVISAHRSKNSQLLTTGEIISPTIDMQFFLPDLPEKKRVFGNFQTITVFKLSRSQLFLQAKTLTAEEYKREFACVVYSQEQGIFVVSKLCFLSIVQQTLITEFTCTCGSTVSHQFKQHGHTIALAIINPLTFLPLYTQINNDMYESKIDQLLDIGEFFSTNSFVLISFFLIVIMIAFGSFCLLDYNTEFLD